MVSVVIAPDESMDSGAEVASHASFLPTKVMVNHGAI